MDAVREVEVTEEDADDTTKWRRKIRCGDPSREQPKEEVRYKPRLCELSTLYRLTFSVGWLTLTSISSPTTLMRSVSVRLTRKADSSAARAFVVPLSRMRAAVGVLRDREKNMSWHTIRSAWRKRVNHRSYFT